MSFQPVTASFTLIMRGGWSSEAEAYIPTTKKIGLSHFLLSCTTKVIIKQALMSGQTKLYYLSFVEVIIVPFCLFVCLFDRVLLYLSTQSFPFHGDLAVHTLYVCLPL